MSGHTKVAKVADMVPDNGLTTNVWLKIVPGYVCHLLLENVCLS